MFLAKLPVLAVAVVAAVVAAGCGGSAEKGSETPTIGTSLGNIAPDVTVYTVPQGKAVKLSSYRGKPVFLNLWASWCGPCRSEMPAMEEMHKSFGDRLAVLAVAINDDISNAEHFFIEGKFSYTFLFDEDGAADRTFSGSSVPRTILISGTGRIMGIIIGARDWSSEGCAAVLREVIKGSAEYVPWDLLKGC